MKKIILMVITIVVIALLSGCQNEGGEADSIKTIKIGYMPITHAIPLFMQEEYLEGSNADFEVELVRFSSWPDLMDDLNTGRIDGASTLITVAMKANELGIDLRGAALGHREGNVLVGANDIEETGDLKGETFAIPHKISTHNVLLYLMLKKEGLSYEDVNTVEMSPAEMPAALAEGRIKGYVVAEPFGAQSVSMGNGKVLYQSDDLWKNPLDCALVFQEDFIDENRALAESFAQSYIEAAQVSDKKDDHVREVSSDYMNIDEEVMNLSMEWISYDDLKINEASYNELRVYLQEMGLSEDPPEYDDFVDNTLFGWEQ